MSHTMKIWERVIFARIKEVAHVSENQFGFVSGRSTIDAIHILRHQVEKSRAQRRNLHAIFIDLEKAFDRVPRDLVWKTLREKHIPESTVKVVKDMYLHATSQVLCASGVSEKFSINVGVHQGSALSPLIFNLVMDTLTRQLQDALPWTLLYADDVALLSENADALQNKLSQWAQVLETNGLRISRQKTEHVTFAFNDSDQIPKFYIGAETVSTSKSFKYLGSIVSDDCSLDREVTNRIQASWQSWRAVSGVLCDKKMPIKLKGKVYKAVVRPAMAYASECWPLTTKQEQRIHVAEMRMLRWASGVTKLDKISNKHIRGSCHVAPIIEKLRENRLRWYGHIMRRPDQHATKKLITQPLPSMGRGRPFKSWLNTIKNDMQRSEVSKGTTQDRVTWRLRTRRADPN